MEEKQKEWDKGSGEGNTEGKATLRGRRWKSKEADRIRALTSSWLTAPPPCFALLLVSYTYVSVAWDPDVSR